MNMIEYAEKFIGTPYLYGANGAHGFDCSSFIAELLMAYAIIPNKSNVSAQGIYDFCFRNQNRFQAVNISAITIKSPMDLLFFGKSLDHIEHVEMVYNDYQWIGCAGGDSTTIDIKSAQIRGAMVRLRPSYYRKDLIAVWRIT